MITKIALIFLAFPFKTFLFLFSPTIFKKTIGVSVSVGYLRDENDRHPHLIMDEIDNKYISLGLSTKAKKGKNKKAGKNKPLKINPLGGNFKSYMRRKATIANKERYKDIVEGKIDNSDYAVARHYSDIAKKEYKKK